MEDIKQDNHYLAAGLKDGDPVVFKMIYKLHWQRLYNIAFYYLREEADAEDAVQDVFISLWSRRETLELKGPLENYLVRSAKYTAFFYLKMKQKRVSVMAQAPLPGTAGSPDESLHYKDLHGYLLALLDTLSQKTQEIFLTSRFEGLSYAEIAERQQVSVKTVEYHISLALKMLNARVI